MLRRILQAKSSARNYMEGGFSMRMELSGGNFMGECVFLWEKLSTE
jgi:hypothetical protein